MASAYIFTHAIVNTDVSSQNENTLPVNVAFPVREFTAPEKPA